MATLSHFFSQKMLSVLSSSGKKFPKKNIGTNLQK
jgi:hypothetical protein